MALDSTITSIGHIARLQRVADNDAPHVAPLAILAELCEEKRAWFLFESARNSQTGRH